MTLAILRSREPLALDQGLFACFGRWIPRGWLPYRDLFDPKPPLQLYTFALGFGLGGSAESIWWFEVAYLTTTMLVAGVIVARRFGRWAGLLAGAFLVVGLWSPGWGGYWTRAQAEVFAALPLLGSAVLALSALTRPSRALIVGVLVGVAGLYKIPAMGIAGAWATLWLLRLGVRGGVRRTLLLGAGMTLPWSAALGWFALHGASADMVGSLFPFPTHMRIAASVGASPGRAVFDAAATLAREVPGLVLAATLGCGLLYRKRPELAVWLGAFTIFAFASIVAQHKLFRYHFLLAMPPLALAAAVGCVLLAQRLADGSGPRWVSAAALTSIALLLAWRVPTWHDVYAGSARLLGATEQQRPDLLRAFEVVGFSPRVEEELASYLRAHTSPSDSLLIWGLAPGAYALADRRPITRYAFHKILLTEAPLSRSVPGLAGRRKELVETFVREPPAYFVLGQHDENGFEPDDSRVSLLRFPQLADLVRRDYQAETAIGNFMLFRRRSGPGHPPPSSAAPTPAADLEAPASRPSPSLP